MVDREVSRFFDHILALKIEKRSPEFVGNDRWLFAQFFGI